MRQVGPEAGNVPEMEEGSFCDLVDMRYEQRVGSKMIPGALEEVEVAFIAAHN